MSRLSGVEKTSFDSFFFFFPACVFAKITEFSPTDRFDETDGKWNGILREIQYASGATVLGVRLNTLRLTRM